jgi:P27 family predicted phage terminase small subunit
MANTKPIPTALKLLRGNPGKRPLNKNEPTFSDALPVAPEWLTKRAKDVFTLLATRLNEMGYASASHTEALALAAMRQDEIEHCNRALARGYTFTVITDRGGKAIKPRPEVAMRAEAARHLQSLLVEFGLTPSAATKIVVPRRQKKNPFQAL